MRVVALSGIPVPPELAGAQRTWARPVKKSPTRRRGCEGVKLLLGPMVTYRVDLLRTRGADKESPAGAGPVEILQRCRASPRGGLESRRSSYLPLEIWRASLGTRDKKKPCRSRASGCHEQRSPRQLGIRRVPAQCLYPLIYDARHWGQGTKQGPSRSRGQGRDGGRRSGCSSSSVRYSSIG